MSFETVVRPVVPPDIRPQSGQPVPPPRDPNQGLVVITGSSGRTLDLPYGWSVSMSQSKRVETERRVDVVRVYQQEDKTDPSSIDATAYIDVAVPNKVRTRGGKRPVITAFDPEKMMDESLKILEQVAGEKEAIWLKRAREADNIKVLLRDVIETNPDDPGE